MGPWIGAGRARGRGTPAALRQQILRTHPERVRKFPHRAQRDRPAALDPLVVPQAEAAIHHVFLREPGAQTQLTDALADLRAVALEGPVHRVATLGSPG